LNLVILANAFSKSSHRSNSYKNYGESGAKHVVQKRDKLMVTMSIMKYKSYDFAM